MRALGANVVHRGDDCVTCEMHARKDCISDGKCFISPYNDYDVLVG